MGARGGPQVPSVQCRRPLKPGQCASVSVCRCEDWGPAGERKREFCFCPGAPGGTGRAATFQSQAHSEFKDQWKENGVSWKAMDIGFKNSQLPSTAARLSGSTHPITTIVTRFRRYRHHSGFLFTFQLLPNEWIKFIATQTRAGQGWNMRLGIAGS